MSPFRDCSAASTLPQRFYHRLFPHCENAIVCDNISGVSGWQHINCCTCVDLELWYPRHTIENIPVVHPGLDKRIDSGVLFLVMVDHLTSRIDKKQSTASNEGQGTCNTTTQATHRQNQHYHPDNGPTMRCVRCSLSPGRTLMTSSSLLIRFLLLASVYNVICTGNVHTMS